MTQKKSKALKGKRTYAAVGTVVTLLVAQKLKAHMPAELADLLASEAVGYVEIGLAAAALYFRAKATPAVEHTDTQDEASAGPTFDR